MSEARRYSEREIAAIFKQAAKAQEAAQQQLARREGLTLEELQAIGREAGITPDFIVQAAAAVDRGGPPPPPTTYLGVPVTAARTTYLPGPFTDDDWDRLVADLRETFHATGKIRRDGSLRQWSNGNLRVLVEPVDDGHRLRLRTRKGDATSALGGGATLLVVGLLLSALILVLGEGALDPDVLFLSVAAMLAGLGLLGTNAVRLPRWAETRARQMEAVAGRAEARASARQAPALREADPPARLDLDASPDPVAAPRPRGRTRT